MTRRLKILILLAVAWAILWLGFGYDQSQLRNVHRILEISPGTTIAIYIIFALAPGLVLWVYFGDKKTDTYCPPLPENLKQWLENNKGKITHFRSEQFQGTCKLIAYNRFDPTPYIAFQPSIPDSDQAAKLIKEILGAGLIERPQERKRYWFA